jgi:hypothetical protein
MTEPSNADQARHADAAMRSFLLADGRTALNPREAITALITSLRHYADRLGTDFGDALSTSSTDYARQREHEEDAYAIGQEIRLRTRAVLTPSLASLPARGVVDALYPGGSGTQMYAIRFPGETSAMPFTADEIEPAPTFPQLRISRGVTVTSLVQAEDLLTAAITRIRQQQIRNRRPSLPDISDRRALSVVLDEICDLSPGDTLTQFEHQAATTDGFRAMAAASELGRRHGNAGIEPVGGLNQPGNGYAHLMSMLGPAGRAADRDRAHQVAIVTAYRDAYVEAWTSLAPSKPAGPADRPARLAARDFPGSPGEPAAPDGARAAASNSYTARDTGQRPGPRSHPQ